MFKMVDYSAANRDVSKILEDFGVLPEVGLSSEEVKEKLSSAGRNEISSKETSARSILWRQFKSPFIFLLVAASVLTLVLGEKIDGILILIFILINVILGFVQEYHSENAINKLKQFISPEAWVLRDGRKQKAATSSLVAGDVLLFSPGDIIAADIRFIKVHNLEVDESMLTGESEPVKKIVLPVKEPVSEVFQALNLGFSSTTIVSGEGKGVVIATGKRSILGEIGRLVGESTRISSFEKGIAKFSRFVLRLIISTIIFVFVANIVIRGNQINLLELTVFSAALTVSVIPEALPIVITFSLSRGALRMAKKKVVVKRLSAIEDLGSIEILCTDKTGTITENSLVVADCSSSSPDDLFFFAGISSALFNSGGPEPTNPFDFAFWKKLSQDQKEEIKKYKKISDISFDPQRRYDTILSKKGKNYELISRGAPEAIIPLCSNLTPKQKEEAENWLYLEGKSARRVLAVAKKTMNKGVKAQNLEKEENEMQLLGFVSFIDPLRKSTPEAISLAKKLGIQVKIISGDRPEVVGAVSSQVEITKNMDEVINGADFEKMDQKQKEECVEKFQAFARISPLQKYEIIKLLENKYEVGFLGDGINDAPALKIANVALAASGSTDIARETADIILLKKSLKVVIDGIKEGRKIFANTNKYIVATLASNFGNFYAMVAVSFLIPTLPMLPIQILLLNLLSDFPMISIATDNVDPEELRSPRSYKITGIASIATILGLVSSVFDFLMFSVLFRVSTTIFQTGWFVGSALTELVFLFSIRTRFFFWKAKRPSRPVLFFTTLCAFLAIFLPLTAFGQETFHFVKLGTGQIFLILAIVATYFATTEFVKLIYYRFSGNN